MIIKRIVFAAVGVVVMLFAGFIYAWSILSSFIAADFPQWSSAALSLTFTLCMAFFCLGGMAAGLLSKRIPVKVNVMIAAALFLAGFFLASRAQSLVVLYMGYGVLCGAGSGMAYNGVLNVMPRWFPDNPGLISGVLLMGFGASSLIIGSVFTTVTPELTGAWRASFMVMGVLIAAVLFVCSFLFIPPKEGELPQTKKAEKSGDETEMRPEFGPGQMLRQSSFWVYWVWAILLSGVGLAIVAQAKPIVMEVGAGVDAGIISLIVGLISVCNGLGRIIMGGLFDRMGAKPTMRAINVIFVICSLILISAFVIQSLPLVVAAFLGIGIGYGGCPTMSAAFTRANYGNKNYPLNLSIMNINLLIASFFGTMAGALYDASGSFMTTLIVLAICAAAALLIIPVIKIGNA